MLHTLNVSIPSPRQFTYPFCYAVDPLAEAASLALQRCIADADQMSTEGEGLRQDVWCARCGV